MIAISKNTLVTILFLFFSFWGTLLKAQTLSKRSSYLKDKIDVIDSLINNKSYDEALTILRNVDNTFTLKDGDKEKLELEYRHARILYENGDEEKALNILLKGYENLKNNHYPDLKILYLNDISKIFATSKNFDKALYYNRIAYREASLRNDTVNMLIDLNRFGSFYFAKNNLDSAKVFYRKVTLFKQSPDTEVRIANAYNNLGVIYEYEGKINMAKYYARKALRIKERIKDTVGIVYSNINLGNLNHHDKNFQEAIKKYEKAYNVIANDTTLDGSRLKKVIFDNLSVAYDSLGDYKKAYTFLVRSNKLGNKINDNSLAERIAEVEAKFNISKHEHQMEIEKNKAMRAQVLLYGLAFVTITFVILVIIFYKNYKLKQLNRFEQVQNEAQTKIINATIDAKENERKKIAEILHDSVSALLSSANLHIQASKSHLKKDIPEEINKAQEIIGEASVKIRDLSHELISSVLLKFGLAFAVHDICQKYSNSELELVSDDNGIKRYDQQFEIKIYNIIEELINNIIKHSKAKHASINLIERNGNKLIIQIIDDGVGFDVKKGRAKDGLGLSHIEARIKVMQGVFNINSKKGEGTSIFISVPIYQTSSKTA